MLASLDSILLGRQAIGIIAHGVQHVEASLALVSRIDVACYVAQRVSHMQAGATRVREHVENIELGFVLVDIYLVGIIIFPVLLPFLFNLVEVVFHIVDIIFL